MESVGTYRIAKNIYNNAYRNKRQEQQNLRDFYDSQKSHVLHIAKSQNPANEVQLNDEVEAVQRKIETLPEDLRVAFGLYCRDGFSVETIASMLDVSISTVRKRIAKARKLFTDRNEYMAIAFLTTPATLAPFQEMIRQFRQLALETGNVGDLLATANSGSPETTAAGATAAGSLISRILWAVFSLPLLLLLWVVSLLLSGQVCGMTFVRNAPSTQARRWLVKQLLICYGGMICLPVLGLILNGYLVKAWGWDSKDVIYTTIFILFGLLITSYVIWAKRKYLKVCENPTAIKIDQNGLQLFTHRWYWILSLIVAGIVATILYHSIPVCRFYWNTHRPEHAVLIIIAFTICIGILIFHINVYYCFRYFLRLSKEEYSNPNSISPNYKISRIYEVVCVVPFVIFTVVPQVFGILNGGTHVAVPFILSFLFLTVWGGILYRNIKRSYHRWRYLFGTLALQMLILAILKHYLGLD